MDSVDQAFDILVIPALHSSVPVAYLRFLLHNSEDGLHGVEQPHGCYGLLVTRVGCLQNLNGRRR
jgi:hypothetical protein